MDNNAKLAAASAVVMVLAIIASIFFMQSAPAAEELPEPSPTPLPSPTPVPPTGVAVKPAYAGFEDEVRESLPHGFTIAAQDDAGITLMYMPEPYEVGRTKGSRVIFTDIPEIIVEGTSGVILDRDSLITASWDALYTYPTHSAPVRLLTLLQTADGKAHEVFSSMLREGKLQDKGLYIADSAELTASEWTAQALDAIPVGLLDTIYAETAELAVQAVAALRADDRNDSVEVICAEMNEELLGLMMDDHWTMGAASGVSSDGAMELMMELVRDIDRGSTQTVTLSPYVIYSDDVYALMNEGLSADEIMQQLIY